MGKNTAKKGEVFYGIWIVMASFVLLFLFAGAGFYSFSIFIKPLEETFGWSRAAISLAMSIYMIIHGVCGPFVGFLAEKYGPKKIMTIFAAGSGLFFILVSFTQSLWYFYLIYAFLSIFTTGIGFIPVSSLLAKWFVRRRGTAIGFAMVGISAGGFIMSPLVGMLNSHFSWRVSYIFLGLMVWGLGLPLAQFVMKGSPAEIGLLPDGDRPDKRVKSAAMMDRENAGAYVENEGWPLHSALKSKTFWWIAATYFLAPMAQGGILQHQVPLVSEAGISPTVAAIALGITAGMGGLGKLVFGRISETLPFHYVATLCFGLQALAVLLLLTIKSLAVVWLYVILYGFSMGGIIVLLPLAVGHFFGLAAFGTLVGAVSFIQGIGASGGAFISGLMYDYFGSYQYALILFFCVYLIAIATIFMAGKPKAFKQSWIL